jgi:hypothetical protein
MSHINDVETMIFVTYQVAPIQAAFKDSLYQHLLDTVWGDRGMVDEDIRVMVNSFEGESCIREIRYQFGEYYDKFLAREIGELIDKEIKVWAAKTNLHEIICA